MEKPDALALSVADKVLDHLRTMYPDALKAVPTSAATSLRNVTASAAQSAILSAVEEEREACAKIADPIETDERMSDYEKQCFDLRDVISQNIRNRKGA